MLWTAVDSPIGVLGVGVTDAAVVRVTFRPPPRPEAGGGLAADRPVATAAAAQLREFFAGTRTRFDLPMAAHHGSAFEQAVWGAIAAIPYGETSAYGAIARAVGEPGGAQAVGLACNRNPLPILVPCHRVIGADGKLVGFGGGLARKRMLLELEARISIERTFAGGSV